MPQFDLCVIGSGPGGQKAAIQAAKLGRKVCVVERMETVGGVAINTGTIPSKAIREAVLSLTRGRDPVMARRDEMGREVTVEGLIGSCQRVVQIERQIVFRQLGRNGIKVIFGHARFVDDQTVEVVSAESNAPLLVGAKTFIIGVGTRPAKPPGIPFDRERIVTTDELMTLPKLPSSMIVIGGGVIGTEYASIFAELGIRVILVERRDRLLDFVDTEIGETLQYHLRAKGLVIRTGEKVSRIETIQSDVEHRQSPHHAQVVLESGKVIRAECVLYCVGRQGATDDLGLDQVGLEADARGRIRVDSTYRTENPNIYAVGDVVGFPALASTSMNQGRVAACHIYGETVTSIPELFPFGVYAIPEISMVGKNEQALTAASVPYESGVARYKEIARGQIMGEDVGLLKILFSPDDHKILGVHGIGMGATEIIHIGQAVMAFGGTVDYFVDTVFNYPTLAECFKVAALNGLNKLRT